MRRFLSVTLFVALAACAAVAPSRTITPVSVGDISIGMKAGAVGGLDTPFRDSQLHDECIQFSADHHARLVMFQNGVVMRIEVLSPQYRTAEGIHVGSSEAEVKAAYGKQLTSRAHKYVAKGHYLSRIVRGAGYIFETDGKTVTRIRVGREPALSYAEGCL